MAAHNRKVPVVVALEAAQEHMEPVGQELCTLVQVHLQAIATCQ